MRRRIILGALCLFLMTLAAAGISGLLKGESALPALSSPPISQNPNSSTPKEMGGDMGPLAAYLPEYPNIAEVINKPMDYPASLIDLFLRNEETLNYLLGYPNRLSGDIDISEEANAPGLPHFLQWDSRWGYTEYGSDMMGITGCGPTSLAMVAVGLTGREDYDPAAVAKYSFESGHYNSGSGTSWSLMQEGPEYFGLRSEELPLVENTVLNALENGIPIICSMGSGDFTDSGHFIVLTGISENGDIEVLDPNSRLLSARPWRYDELKPQIKNLWAFYKV